MGTMAEKDRFSCSDVGLSNSVVQRARSDKRTQYRKTGGDRHIHGHSLGYRWEVRETMSRAQRRFNLYFTFGITLNMVMQVGRIKGWWS